MDGTGNYILFRNFKKSLQIFCQHPVDRGTKKHPVCREGCQGPEGSTKCYASVFGRQTGRRNCDDFSHVGAPDRVPMLDNSGHVADTDHTDNNSWVLNGAVLDGCVCGLPQGISQEKVTFLHKDFRHCWILA
jgi:hypothetical protein